MASDILDLVPVVYVARRIEVHEDGACVRSRHSLVRRCWLSATTRSFPSGICSTEKVAHLPSLALCTPLQNQYKCTGLPHAGLES